MMPLKPTPCTSCHAEQGGVLACSTCHGDGARAAPPRDRCFFPEDVPRAGAHVAHVEPSAVRSEGLACKTCHPVPDSASLFGGAHANGAVDVSLDPTVAGQAAQYHAGSGVCSTTCHARPGAAKPAPAWSDAGPLACGDCHGDPPPRHLAGACTSCHREADATGARLTAPRLHVNGRVDLGDGSGACGACHGHGDDPWPGSGAHATHRAPDAAAAVACQACHDVPTTFGPGTEHPHGGPAVVRFSGLAVARGAQPSFASGTCSQVYCHGAGLIGPVAPARAWLDASGAAKACDGGCHGAPSGPPHIADTSCWKCHPSDVDPGPRGPTISVPARHVNGVVDK